MDSRHLAVLGLGTGAAAALYAWFFRKARTAEKCRPMSLPELVADLARQWRADLLENVVPFWQEHSLDLEHGGYFTALDRHGKLIDDAKYVWLQGRAVFMWSRLYNELGSEVSPHTAERWFDAAKLGADWVAKHGKDTEGRIYFAVSRDGSTPLHMQRKPYAAVFHVLGNLEYAAALRARAAAGVPTNSSAAAPEAYLAEATDYFERLRDWIDDPTLLGRPAAPKAPSSVSDGSPAPAPANSSSLADVMCLSGLSEECLDKLPERREEWLLHVHEAQRRVRLHYDPKRRILMEHADPLHGVSHSMPAGRLFNPGHSIEVAWFLLHLGRVAPDAELGDMALAALEGSLELGWDTRGGGGLVYMMDVLGEPLMDCTVTAEHKLWWPHTEALYACMLALELTFDPKWYTWLRRIHDFIYTKLCDARGGGEWFGYLRPDGTPFNECKGGNCMPTLLNTSLNPTPGAPAGAVVLSP